MIHTLLAVLFFAHGMAAAEERSPPGIAQPPVLLQLDIDRQAAPAARQKILSFREACAGKFPELQTLVGLINEEYVKRKDSSAELEKDPVWAPKLKRKDDLWREKDRCEAAAITAWAKDQPKLIQVDVFGGPAADAAKIGKLRFSFDERLNLTRVTAQALAGKEREFPVDSKRWTQPNPQNHHWYASVVRRKGDWIELLPGLFSKPAWIRWPGDWFPPPDVVALSTDDHHSFLFSFPGVQEAVVQGKMAPFHGRKKYVVSGRTDVSVLVKEFDEEGTGEGKVEYGLPFRLLTNPDGSLAAEISGELGC